MQLLRKITFPISLVYALVVSLRNHLFDIGIFKTKAYQMPIICVGNLSAGGTGKTPMIEYLVSFLKKNHQIAVLSRGYRRKSKGFVLAHPGSDAEELGDEPFQIYSKFPGISIAVDADRQEGIQFLAEKVRPDIILLDDAFQHRKVTAGFNILLTTYDLPYVSDWYLPTGNLRDGIGQAKRANLIIVTKCPSNLTPDERKGMQDRLKPKVHQKVLFSSLSYGLPTSPTRETKSLDFFKGKTLTLVTGIADPAPLIDHLSLAGLTFDHARFKDHHYFSEQELQTLNSKPMVLTTEKDYMRLKGKVEGLFYIPVEHHFLDNDGEVLEREVRDFMKRDF